MQRLFEKILMNWKMSGMKKTLMVIGVRQIGKTYTINKFGQENFEEFLIATRKEFLRDKIKECYNEMKPMPDFAHEQAQNPCKT